MYCLNFEYGFQRICYTVEYRYKRYNGNLEYVYCTFAVHLIKWGVCPAAKECSHFEAAKKVFFSGHDH